MMFSDKFLWDVFSLESERTPMHLDKHGRFPVSETTHPVAMPIVSQRLKQLGWNPTYPNNAPYAVLVSHDIDFVYYDEAQIKAGAFVRSVLKNLLRADFKAMKPLIGRLNIKPEKRWPVEDVVDFFRERGIPSTYYFMCLDQHEQDYNYDINSLEPLVKQIMSLGNEVGLHGGHTAYNNLGDFVRQLDRLKKVTGLENCSYRNHYLKFNLDSFNIMSEVGVNSDSTLGFAEMVGFRNGMAHPFRPYNHKENSFYDFVEIPLMMMDQTFYKYMRLDAKQIKRVSSHIIDRASEVSGVISLLWHNTSFQEEKKLDLTAIINKMKNDKAWFCTPIELIAWYEEKNLFSDQMEYLLKLR